MRAIRDTSLELMEHLHALVRRYLFQARRPGLGPPGPALSRQEMRVLGTIGERAAWTMGALAAALVVAQGSLTVIVDRLVRKGLLARERSTDDRRVVRVRLTSRGRRPFREHRRARLRMARAMLGALDPAEREVFLGLMRKIKDRAVGAGPPPRAGTGTRQRGRPPAA